jgi:hypothetical protein
MLDNVPDGLVRNVKPVEDSVENSPTNGMIKNPRYAYGNSHASERKPPRAPLLGIGFGLERSRFAVDFGWICFCFHEKPLNIRLTI